MKAKLDTLNEELERLLHIVDTDNQKGRDLVKSYNDIAERLKKLS